MDQVFEKLERQLDIDYQISILQAYKGGKEILCKYKRGNGPWIPVTNYNFNFNMFDYKIAPKKPREFWVNIYTDGLRSLCESKEIAKTNMLKNCIECIHLKEVFDAD
jgi:hypothetical protein